jgi:eukaryotic-like serine/threonine-protein kinase
MEYQVGTRVGDYEVLALPGSGGMPHTYSVRNLISGSVAAMKVLLPSTERDPALAGRCTDAIQKLACLDHPGIAAPLAALRADGQLLLLTGQVEGITLGSKLAAGPLPVPEAVGYTAQALAALSYAHGRGAVHGDLKPASIVITPAGTVKLVDFGIAGMTAGSPFHSAPEVIQGAASADPRSDLYSLGVCLYQMVTGELPFRGDSQEAIQAAHLQAAPRPPLQLVPGLAPALNEIILLALQKEPGQRFQTAEAFRNALLSVVPQPVAPPQPVTAAAPQAPPKKATGVPPQPAAMPAPAAPSGGKRGLWIAIGSLVTVALLVLAAMQLPRFRQARAVEQAPAAVTTPAIPQPAPAGQPAIAPVPAPGAAEAVPAHSQTPAPPARAVRLPVSHAPDAVSAPATVQAPLRQMQSTPAAPPAPAPAASGPDPKLAALDGQLNQLDIRAGTVKASISNLRRQQERKGFGLRADMASSEQRMEYLLNQAESAIRKNDAATAARNLELADREISKLEEFLGH